MKNRPVKSEFNFLLNGMVKTRSHIIQIMVYIGKTDVKQCFVTKLHFHCDNFTKIGPVESENHFLLKETIKTRSRMVKMKVYIGKTDHKQCFGTKHHFRAPKSIRMVPSESENHFLLKETLKTRSHMIKMMVYIRFYRKL